MVQLEDRTVRTWGNQIALHVKTAGSGAPVVYLHGAGGLVWDPFLDRLAEQFTVYAPEHPGTTPGDPDAVRNLDNLADLIFMYADTLDRLGLEHTALVGHSFGGMVAAELAAWFPERVGKLVLIGPAGLWRDDAPIRNVATYPPEELPRVLFSDPQSDLARQMFSPPQNGERAAEAQAQFVWAMATTLGKFAWPLMDTGLKKRIYRIKAPTLVIWGQDDGLIPPVYAQEFASKIASARVEND